MDAEQRRGEMRETGGEENIVLGVDGGATSTTCVCLSASASLLDGDSLPDPFPVLARTVAGSSNHNSVGGERVCFGSAICA